MNHWQTSMLAVHGMAISRTCYLLITTITVVCDVVLTNNVTYLTDLYVCFLTGKQSTVWRMVWSSVGPID